MLASENERQSSMINHFKEENADLKKTLTEIQGNYFQIKPQLEKSLVAVFLLSAENERIKRL